MGRVYKQSPGVKVRVRSSCVQGVAEVKKRISIRTAAKSDGIDRMTLKRIIKRGESTLPTFQKAMVFSKAEEELSKYLLKAS